MAGVELTGLNNNVKEGVMGILRESIMKKCSDEFEEELKDFIDEIEGVVVKINDLFCIDNINQLENIVAASELLDQLADDLY